MRPGACFFRHVFESCYHHSIHVSTCYATPPVRPVLGQYCSREPSPGWGVRPGVGTVLAAVSRPRVGREAPGWGGPIWRETRGVPEGGGPWGYRVVHMKPRGSLIHLLEAVLVVAGRPRSTRTPAAVGHLPVAVISACAGMRLARTRDGYRARPRKGEHIRRPSSLSGHSDRH